MPVAVVVVGSILWAVSERSAVILLFSFAPLSAMVWGYWRSGRRVRDEIGHVPIVVDRCGARFVRGGTSTWPFVRIAIYPGFFLVNTSVVRFEQLAGVVVSEPGFPFGGRTIQFRTRGAVLPFHALHAEHGSQFPDILEAMVNDARQEAPANSQKSAEHFPAAG